jgi:hypothetical protein
MRTVSDIDVTGFWCARRTQQQRKFSLTNGIGNRPMGVSFDFPGAAKMADSPQHGPSCINCDEHLLRAGGYVRSANITFPVFQISH